MNREIRFRAWDNYQNEMYDWNNLCELDSIGHLVLTNVLNGFVEHVNPMQFTGLKDKHGEELFVGDIIKCNMFFDGGVLPHIGEIVYVPEFGSYATKNQAGETLLHNHDHSSFELLGNIHQNKELINV